MKKNYKKIHRFTALALLAASMSAQATEGGGSTYPGPENYMVAVAPHPGVFWLSYGNVYSASKVKDNSGNDIPVPGFKLRVNVVTLRGIWVTPYRMLGGNLVVHSILPLVDVTVDQAGASQHKTGFGDVTVGTAIATHYSPQLYTAFGVDFLLPTGDYNQNNLANLGRNYLSIQPMYALSYVKPTGFNGDFKLTFNLNQKNSATQYKSGNEVFVDYDAGYGLGNGWVVGVGGLVRQQFTDDTRNGVTVANNRAHVFAIGPSIKYSNANHWFITAKLQQESSRNTTQGAAFWVKARLMF